MVSFNMSDFHPYGLLIGPAHCCLHSMPVFACSYWITINLELVLLLYLFFGQLKQFRKGSGPPHLADGHATSSRQLTNSPLAHAVQVCMCVVTK